MNDAQRDALSGFFERGVSTERAIARVKEAAAKMDEPKPEYPKMCELCGLRIEDKDDLDWHGLGNCVNICDACTGSGIEDKGALDRIVDVRTKELRDALEELISALNDAQNRYKAGDTKALESDALRATYRQAFALLARISL